MPVNEPLSSDMLPILDLRQQNREGFERWLALQHLRWAHDPVFLQRCHIRDCRQGHPHLRELEYRLQQTRVQYRASSHYARLTELERALNNTEKAIFGLNQALGERVARSETMIRKRDSFLALRDELASEHAAMVESSPERLAWVQASQELEAEKNRTGLAAAEAELQRLQRERGRRSSATGQSFELVAAELTRDRIVPDVRSHRGYPNARLTLLRQVRLGAADLELDGVVVREPSDPSQPVEVLAMIEAKRNINDLGHGFARRQANLTWLTGDHHGYDPTSFRTRNFPTGHFDRQVTHDQHEMTFLFGPESFQQFIRDPDTGFFLDGLYLITRPGPIWGIGSAALARIAAKVSEDEGWNPSNRQQIGDLFAWSLSLTSDFETPEVLRLYSSPARSKQLLLTRNPSGDDFLGGNSR